MVEGGVLALLVLGSAHARWAPPPARLPPAPLRCAVFRSSWLGAEGHDERKKLAEATARVQAAAPPPPQRGVMP